MEAVDSERPDLALSRLALKEHRTKCHGETRLIGTVVFLAEWAVTLVLGFVGGWGYSRYRLWMLRRHAPSAKVTTATVGLSQQDYDRLKKKGKVDKHTVYLTS